MLLYSLCMHVVMFTVYVILFYSGFRLALVQLKVGVSKSENLSKAANYIAKAAKGGAQVVSLPVSVLVKNMCITMLTLCYDYDKQSTPYKSS